MSFKFIVIAILGLSFGAVYLTREPSGSGVSGASSDSAAEAPAGETGFVAQVIAMFSGSAASEDTAEPPQVIRGGAAMHGGSGGRFVSAPER